MTIARARAALAMAKSRPERAIETADRLIADQTDPHTETAVVARWARGTALFEMGRNTAAVAALAEAARVATGELEARIEVSLAAAEAAAGDAETARARLERISDNKSDVTRALAESQLGLIELHAGNLNEGLARLTAAVAPLEADGNERAALARVQGNIGHCLLVLGRIEESRPFHRAALESATVTGQTMIIAGSYQNLGYTELRLGHVAAALASLERSHEAYRTLSAHANRNLATLYDDMAETYRYAGLTREAIRYARLASWMVRVGGNREKSNDADFRRALCLFDHQDFAAAESCARRAAADYRSHGRPIMAERADVVAERASWATAVGPLSVLPSQISAQATRLADAGWAAEALALINAAVDRAIDTDNHAGALRLIEDAPLTDSDDVAVELETNYLAVLRARTNGDELASHLDRCRRFFERSLNRLADMELRANASRQAERFRALALRETLPAASAHQLLLAEDQWRALFSPRRRHSAASNSTSLEHLKQVAGTGSDEALDVTALEGRVRVESFLALGHPEVDVASLVAAGTEDVIDNTGRTLIQFCHDGTAMFGIAVGSTRADGPWRAGSRDAINAIAERVRQALGRLLRPGLSSDLAAELSVSVQHDCDRLSALLLAGTKLVGDVTISPPAELIDLPWSLLVPGNVSSVCIVSHFGQAQRRASAQGFDASPARAALIAGPDLAFAARDITAFTTRFPDAEVVDGTAASTREMKRLLREADILHVASHGTFRADNPRFSSLRLSDGDFTIFEFEEIAPTPKVVILAACEGGRVSSIPGGGAIGVASTLLASGTALVIAPTFPVQDTTMAAVMQRFYGCADHRGPHHWLRGMQLSVEGLAPELWACAHAMQCIGALD